MVTARQSHGARYPPALSQEKAADRLAVHNGVIWARVRARDRRAELLPIVVSFTFGGVVIRMMAKKRARKIIDDVSIRPVPPGVYRAMGGGRATWKL
jgi:hypothetical protein